MKTLSAQLSWKLFRALTMSRSSSISHERIPKDQKLFLSLLLINRDTHSLMLNLRYSFKLKCRSLTHSARDLLTQQRKESLSLSKFSAKILTSPLMIQLLCLCLAKNCILKCRKILKRLNLSACKCARNLVPTCTISILSELILDWKNALRKRQLTG